MKLFALLAATLFISSCASSPKAHFEGGKRVPADAEGLTHQCMITASLECANKINTQCPENMTNGCDTGTTSYHECVASRGPECEQKIDWKCPPGFIDACSLDTSDVHTCVAKEGTQPCNQGRNLECPAGYADICSTQ